MKDLTIILPVHVCDEEVIKLVDKALTSYYTADFERETSLIIVGDKEVIKAVQTTSKTLDPSNVKFVETKETDFANQINTAVSEVETKYFSILELDDKYARHFFKNVKQYAEAYPEISCFIPLNEAYDFQNEERGPLGYINEAFWATSFSEKLGYLDEETVKDYFNINMTGAVIKKEDFVEVGGLKPSIKISFWHEFVLRALNNEKLFYVIPKVGYYHYINRPGSLVDTYNDTISDEEAQWWINLAKEEYLYKNDRKKVYGE